MRITEESKRWVAEGIITDEQRNEIVGLYQKKHTINPVLFLFSIIGSLLLGLGTILIFASNWTDIPKGVKLAIAFLPMLIAMGTVIFALKKKPNSKALREGSSLGLSLSIFATVSLVGQVFQTTSTIPEYLGLCMILSFPILYLFRAKSPALVYVICMIIAGASGDLSDWFSLISVILIVPYLVLEIKKTDSKSVLWYINVLSGAVLTFSIFKVALGSYFGTSTSWLYAWYLLPMILITTDVLIKRIKPFSNMPLTFLSGLTVAILQLIFSFNSVGFDIWEKNGYGMFVVLGVLIFGGYVLIRYMEDKKLSFCDINAPDAIMITALLGLPLFWLWSNLLLLALGVWFIFSGSKSLSLKSINCGMTVLCGVIIARFFDTDLELFIRGIVFIIIGLAFILTNVLLIKKWRAK